MPAPLVRSALGAAANVTRYRTEQNQRVTVGGLKVASDQPYRDSIQYCEERREAFAAFGTALDNLTHNDRRVRKALLTTKVLPICIETIASCGADAVKFWRSVLRALTYLANPLVRVLRLAFPAQAAVRPLLSEPRATMPALMSRLIAAFTSRSCSVPQCAQRQRSWLSGFARLVPHCEQSWEV